MHACDADGVEVRTGAELARELSKAVRSQHFFTLLRQMDAVIGADAAAGDAAAVDASAVDAAAAEDSPVSQAAETLGPRCQGAAEDAAVVTTAREELTSAVAEEKQHDDDGSSEASAVDGSSEASAVDGSSEASAVEVVEAEAVEAVAVDGQGGTVPVAAKEEERGEDERGEDERGSSGAAEESLVAQEAAMLIQAAQIAQGADAETRHQAALALANKVRVAQAEARDAKLAAARAEQGEQSALQEAAALRKRLDECDAPVSNLCHIHSNHDSPARALVRARTPCLVSLRISHRVLEVFERKKGSTTAQTAGEMAAVAEAYDASTGVWSDIPSIKALQPHANFSSSTPAAYDPDRGYWSDIPMREKQEDSDTLNVMIKQASTPKSMLLKQGF